MATLNNHSSADRLFVHLVTIAIIGHLLANALTEQNEIERLLGNYSCDVRVGNKYADTSSAAAVLVFWSIEGGRPSRVQLELLRKNDSTAFLIDHDAQSVIISEENITVAFQVDYSSTATNRSEQLLLDPFENYVVRIANFCVVVAADDCGEGCAECIERPMDSEISFRTPPRSITKMVDGAALNAPSLDSADYCSAASNYGRAIVRLNSSYFSYDGTPGILGYQIVIASKISYGDFDPACFFDSAVSYGQASGDGFRRCFYVTNRSAPLDPFLSADGGCCALTRDNLRSCDGDDHESAGYYNNYNYSSVDILIGGDSDCGDDEDPHCVGLLPAGQEFWVGILAVPNTEICSSGVIYCGHLLDPVYLNTSLVIGSIDERRKTSNGKYVGAILITCITAGAIVICGITIFAAVMCYRRHRCVAVVPSSGSADQIGRSKPIALSEFNRILPQLLRDSAFALLEEFSALSEQTNSSSVDRRKRALGCKVENMPKNRYIDIIPFDETRVRLKGDRYVNASFIRGFTRSKEYIAAQGPLGEDDRRTREKHSTLDDFFEMIWQYRVHYVVMLTHVFEAGKPKCAQYWPSDVGRAVQHGVFTVRLASEVDYENYRIREIELRKSGRNRSIRQFHYKHWADMSVTNERILLDFIHIVRSAVKNSRASTPILVHCSAGVGRTGVFIALDLLLQRIRRHSPNSSYSPSSSSHVDILACVYSLRQQRVRMVQLEEQYIMLYKAVGLAIEQL